MNPFRATPSPQLIEVAARPWIRRVRPPDAPPGLDGVPDEVLDDLRRAGYHGVWLMGAWTTGPEGRRLALENAHLRETYDRILPGWTEDDVEGSPYSVQAYEPGPDLGGEGALARFRARLHTRGLGLMLDFVPNHLACDHPWIRSHPERLVTGTEEDLAAALESWFRVDDNDGGKRVFAHGRDPHFAGWTDTVQVDYRKAETRRAMTEVLRGIAARCDAVRCDVAMLLLPDVFEKTWGPLPDEPPGDFWRDAIAELRAEELDVVLLAEAYWGREPDLVAAGFDFAYDKGLYDALLADDVAAVRERLAAPADDLAHGAHFVENHDERRAAAAFGERLHAAAVLTYAPPGLRFFHDGQAEGCRLHVPVQLARAPREPVDEDVRAFHERLRAVLRDPVWHRGDWTAIEVRPPGPDEDVPPLIAGGWRLAHERRIVVANLSGETARGRLPIAVRETGPSPLALRDELSDRVFERDRSEMREPGVFVELPAWGAHVLKLADPPG